MKNASRLLPLFGLAVLVAFLGSCDGCDAERRARIKEAAASLKACEELIEGGLRPIGDVASERFLGKVEEATAMCRGG